ncbi:hypothetical protein PPL_02222 [Heterostelium album PN500]|uniref:BLOC-1-related complex subunit 7 n=1 Tax=Heterostelium pallidum (strain ATCC 26659 / Pp 5 / PN500) TaxID=670386 RepID=D3B1P8_HETP5|nr:hypothetical protein PPL_02222 [Heterostelium album PN500]EFA85222.1 hypothetical protein PPL_02222 [Heterostelium album PN500]|eukprot:XP_020437331.1 hypothetical protein PPL_02222 [Heterostelium album PN500]
MSQTYSNSGSASLVTASSTHIEDPSLGVKKELTESGEVIITELGKSIKSLIKHSNNMLAICKAFAQHEVNVMQTDDMINQMNSLSKELNQQVNILSNSLKCLDSINYAVVDVNKTAHSFTTSNKNLSSPTSLTDSK